MSSSALRSILTRAEGYLELAMYEDAESELAALSAAERMHPEAVFIRLNILLVRRQWAEAAALAGLMADKDPHNAHWWVQCAYATRRAESLEAAEKILLRAAGIHAGDAIVWFNLACYACVTGRLDEARQRLAKACAVDEGCHELARADEDLRALWPELRPAP